MSEPEPTHVRRREQDFHDDLAAQFSPESLPPRPPDPLEASLLERLGPLTGRHVLDAGCGSGDLCLQVADRGARITGLDISSGMVELARARLACFYPSVPADFVVAPLEDTGLPAASLDVVIGKWVLHHADVEQCAVEVKRILRPGGVAVFIENSGLNPILRFAREHVIGRFGIPRLGTIDEHPLVSADYQKLADVFGRVSLHFPQFEFFRLLDRQVLRFRSRPATRLATALDSTAQRMPRLRPYSFRVLVEATRD